MKKILESIMAGRRGLVGFLSMRISARLVGAALCVGSGTFVAAQTPRLAVTEIMYHAAPPPSGSTNLTEDLSYIELRNIGPSALNLAGFRMTRGIEFVFVPGSGVTDLAPGGFVLVVKNSAAFASRYPAAANVAGQFSGSLDNSGERIVIEGPSQEVVADFSYDNAWCPATDGNGFSLVLSNQEPAGNVSYTRSNWRASSQVGGSPGQLDPAPPIRPVVLVNELLPDPELEQVDTVELFNPSSASANIGGWFLSDAAQSPKKYRIPDGTTIPAGGFLLLDERRFRTGASGSFSFSGTGEEVFLFSGDGTNLTGYAHGFGFGAVLEGQSFGRHVTSTGDEHFAIQRQLSLGATNAGPYVGPLVISEIMFHPPAISSTNNVIDEYVELHNITTQIVRLSDPENPTNTWRLLGGAEFQFPINTVVPSQGYALVVNFDPAAEPNALAGFRAKYGLDAAIPIHGPYRGNLSNEGERIGLHRPGPSSGTNVAFVLVDAVEYSNANPWPTGASGSGSSLQRQADDQYGNDPINWLAAAPTPGRATVIGAVDSDRDGLQDSWEIASFDNLSGGAADDPDRDGASNLNEFTAGTDPTNPSSHLRVEAIRVSGGTASLSFNAVAGKTYSVLYRDDLLTDGWLKLSDVPARTTTGNAQVTDIATRPSRFYRLATPQAP